MTQTFDDFANQQNKERENRERLLKETKAEWDILRGFVSQFALDEKGLGKYKFTWSPDYPPRLVLNDVAASFLHLEKNGVPENPRVMFDRRPPGAGRMFLDDKSPVSAIAWSLEPEIIDDEFVWSVEELDGKKFSTGRLADEIAKQLARHHVAYEKAYDREP